MIQSFLLLEFSDDLLLLCTQATPNDLRVNGVYQVKKLGASL